MKRHPLDSPVTSLAYLEAGFEMIGLCQNIDENLSFILVVHVLEISVERIELCFTLYIGYNPQTNVRFSVVSLSI